MAVALTAAAAAPADAQVEPYQANDGGGFRNILPPGENGLINAPQLGAFAAAGARPPHSQDQLRMYSDLVYATPGLTQARLQDFFKDASFGVRAGDVERTYTPRPDVTIVRDKGFGVPHIYGKTRAGAMFGTGYAGAEDRLFFMDVLRNLGRAQLSSFAGGAEGNRALDRDEWLQTPYTEADLQKQIDQLDDLYGAEGARIQDDTKNYVEGVNAYISQTKLNPLLMPAEYAAIGRPTGAEPWNARDIIATAALVGGIFGNGGGNELASAMAYQDARKRFGRRKGSKVWRDFRSAEDPEAPTTVARKRFPYEVKPKKVRKGSVALPDRGSLQTATALASTSGSRSVRKRGSLSGLLAFPKSESNALLVSGRESATGHPVAVMGPQTGYFAPQILMEEDIHAPTIDARGAAFPGVNLYVQLGRGRDYAFSATSAGQDIIDTFASDLCEPGGGKPTLRSTHHLFRGQCLPIETLERTNSWSPTAADMTPAGTETLRSQRTKMGIVTARGTIRGKPVIYTKLRTTYLHEVDSALGFVDFNNPDAIKGPRDFQRAASKIGYTFNWLYADNRDIAYFNSGNNPVRAKGIDPNFPTRARFVWKGFNPNLNTAAYTSFGSHPQVVNQRFLTSWNNKQAPGYRAADGNFEFSPIYRSQSLDDRVRAGIRGKRKMTLPQLVDAMETAGVVDVREDRVVPLALRVLGRQKSPALRNAIAALEAWKRDGALRKDANRDGRYEHADAIRILDAWWPRLARAQFEPALGKQLYERFIAIKDLDNTPNNHGDHLGSAYQGGTYGLVQKDLRTLLGPRRLRRAGYPRSIARVRGRYSRTYCGGTRKRQGTLRRCRRVLARSLEQALAADDPKTLYKDELCESQPSLGPKDPGRKAFDQMCFDSVHLRPLGAAEQPVFHWINRPTFQQAVEIPSRAPR